MAPLRILLADDHALFLRGIESLLSWSGGFEVVGKARDGLEAVALARQTQPDLILMDVDMPRCNGLAAVRQIKREMPDLEIVMLTVSDSSQDLFEAIKAGARGYLLKSVEPEQLISMLKGVIRGEAALSGLIAANILEEFARLLPSEPDGEPAVKEPDALALVPSCAEQVEPLSEREIEILQLLATGRTNQQIADTLVITVGTVKTHVGNILTKLHLKNRVQLAVYATRHGLVEHSLK